MIDDPTYVIAIVSHDVGGERGRRLTQDAVPGRRGFAAAVPATPGQAAVFPGW